ncbi:MAG: class I SAM-dependent methyltransferase [Candidatus Schekmanbacteria bacterium]|nr:class I SAM-dependent methyltransferase [Candidatus Schekmanbacteria bacterium]
MASGKPHASRLVLDGRHYEYVDGSRKEDLSYWARWAETISGPILEAGCGTGRVGYRLAAKGHRVYGVDIAPELLLYGRRHRLGPNMRYVQACMRALPFDIGFTAVIYPYSVFNHNVTDEEALQCLAEAHRVLLPGGEVVLDLINMTDDRACDDADAFLIAYSDPDDVGFIRVSQATRYDGRTRRVWLDRRHLRSDGARASVTLAARFYRLEDVAALAEATGLRVASVAGGYENEELDQDSDVAVIHLRKLA